MCGNYITPHLLHRGGRRGQARQGQPSGAFGDPGMNGAPGRTSYWGSGRMGTRAYEELPRPKCPRRRNREACRSTRSVHACETYAARVTGGRPCARPCGDSSEQTSSPHSHGAHLLVGEQTRKSRKNEYEATGKRAPHPSPQEKLSYFMGQRGVWSGKSRWGRVPSGRRARSGPAEGTCVWLSGGRREAALGTSDIALSGGRLGTSEAFKQKSDSLWLP